MNPGQRILQSCSDSHSVCGLLCRKTPNPAASCMEEITALNTSASLTVSSHSWNALTFLCHPTGSFRWPSLWSKSLYDHWHQVTLWYKLLKLAAFQIYLLRYFGCAHFCQFIPQIILHVNEAPWKNVVLILRRQPTELWSIPFTYQYLQHRSLAT